MISRLGHGRYLAISFLATASCVQAQRTAEPLDGRQLQELLGPSRSDRRYDWWPAVSQLGELASIGSSARDQIWASAKVNGLGMKFVEVTPGSFMQGPDVHRLFSMAVAHRVALSEGYFIGVTEVTNAQFQAIFPDYKPDLRYSPDPDSPAVNVAWKEADDFCKLLSEKEGAVYRLPTEAEWEYACRAGTETLFAFGDDAGGLVDYAWYGHSRAERVAMLQPNRWGIYDMHGNAFEWVSDWFDIHYQRDATVGLVPARRGMAEDVDERVSDWLGVESYYLRCRRQGIVRDPKGAGHGWTHVLRGGGWIVGNALACSSTARMPLPVLDRVPFSSEAASVRQATGFRVVREHCGTRE